MLTKRQIETAKRDRTHIVIQTLDSLGDGYWENFMQQYNSKANPICYRQDLCYRVFFPFVDALEGNEFTLNPLEIISIWAKAEELFPQTLYPKYELSRNLAIIYGASPITSPQWKNICKKTGGEKADYLDNLAQQEKTEAGIFRRRLSELDASLEEIDNYRERLQGSAEDCKTNRAFLGELLENWGNGICWMFDLLPRIKQ